MTYTVKKGDNLTKIALMFGVTVREIVSLNGIKNPNLIQPGQILRIPVQVDNREAIKIINECVADIQALPSFKRFVEMIEND